MSFASYLLVTFDFTITLNLDIESKFKKNIRNLLATIILNGIITSPGRTFAAIAIVIFLVILIFKKLSFKSGVVIAHSLSTIRNANGIITLDRGYIIQQDTHDKLISEENGLYKKLYEIQLRDNDGL